MNMKLKKIVLSLALSVYACASFFALKVPELTGPVIDKAHLLSQNEFETLDAELRSISEQTGVQIAVLTIPTLEGLDIESYSMSVVEAWKLGSAKEDNGVLLLVAYAEKKIRIEVGYGLEGQLTDTKCGLIIRNIMAPRFQAGMYGKGIVEAVTNIEALVGVGDVTVSSHLESEGSNPNAFPVLAIFLFIYFFLLSGALSTKFPFLRWLPWAMLFKSARNHNNNHHNDFFGGGSSGGGFGGFSGGGGGFGGGGASGGW